MSTTAPQSPLNAGERPMDRQTLMRGAAVVGAVFLIGLAFVWSYMGALSNPKFHGVEVAVLGPPALLDHLDAGGELSGTPVRTRQEAIRRIDDRRAYGAVLVGPRGIEVLVAPAAGRAVATILGTTLPPALKEAVGPHTPVRVVDVKPLPDKDPNGLAPFYLALAMVVASFMGASSFALTFGLKAEGRRIWWRMLGVAALALALALGEVGIVNAIGPLRGHYLPLVLVSLLLGATVGAVTVALQSLLGIAGTGLAIVTFVVLGNPASGGPYATELLPGLWRTIGHYLPTGAGTDLTRNIAYFGGHALTRPLLVLFLWLSCALVLAALSGPIHTTAVRLRSQRVRAAAERHAVAGT